MSLNIKSQEAHRLARELADLDGLGSICRTSPGSHRQPVVDLQWPPGQVEARQHAQARLPPGGDSFLSTTLYAGPALHAAPWRAISLEEGEAMLAQSAHALPTPRMPPIGRQRHAMDRYQEEGKVSEIHSGDTAEPASLLADHYARVHRYVLSMVHDPAEADDLTQETFLRAYRSCSSLRDAGALITWLYRIATNACLDRWRQRAHRAPLEGGMAPEELDVADSDALSPQQTVERAEMSTCIPCRLT